MLKIFASLARKLKRDRRGNILIISALGAASLVGAAGLGVDTTQWFLAKRQLQQATDSGALAAAMSLYRGSTFYDTAVDEIDRNFPDTVTIERIVNPPQVGAYTADNTAIEVQATVNRKLPFSSIFINFSPVVRTRSVAAGVAVADPCVISLAGDGIGIDIFGTATVDLDCPVSSNSPEGVSVDVGGTSFLDTNMIMSVGGIDYAADNVSSDAAIVPYSMPISDPLADRGLTPPTSPTGCTATSYRVKPSETMTLSAGRYCNGLTIQGTARLNGGLYIIDQGTFQVTAGATLELAGTGGVTFILTGSTSGNVASVTINGGANIDLVGPTEAEATGYGNANWAGILFYQDPLGDGTQHIFNGGSGINFEGIIYMPTAELLYNGGSTQQAQCLFMITERVRFGGTNNIKNNCNDEIDKIDTNARIIKIVE